MYENQVKTYCYKDDFLVNVIKLLKVTSIIGNFYGAKNGVIYTITDNGGEWIINKVNTHPVISVPYEITEELKTAGNKTKFIWKFIKRGVE